MKRKIILGLFAIMFSAMLKGENYHESGLIIKTHVYNDGVAIRWTPVSFHLWRKWSKEGYRLERHTVAKDGEAIGNRESVLLGGKNILPFSELQWKEYSAIRPEANLIKHCLMNKDRIEPADKATYLGEREEDNDCYIFSMLAMQTRFELAIAGGIGFLDKSTKENEVYLYKLYPVNGGVKDTIRFVVNMEEVTILPVIENFRISVKDSRILIQWPAKRYNASYFGYSIEKSLDSGRTYSVLNEVPFVPTYMEGGVEKKYQEYSDTVSRFYQFVHYRLRGIDYFGQYGVPSLSDSVIVFPETSAFPEFLYVDNVDGGKCSIHWQFSTDNEKMIKGFSLLAGDSSDGQYMAIDSILVDAGQRDAELKISQPVSYIKVAAITLNNTMNNSFPLIVQQMDSIPPAPPQLISISIDTSGIVCLNWKTNCEKDFMAYLVFRGNSRSLEFSSVTPMHYKDTFFFDTLNNTLLRDSIYYKVIAIDTRYNESLYSGVIAAFIPNKIPPAPPVIYDIVAESKNTVIRWHRSNSNDINSYHLVRRSVNTNETAIIKIDKESESYKDTLAVAGETYHYSLFAVDISGLVSKTAKPYGVKIPKEKILPGVQVKAVFNDTTKNYISVFWDYRFDSEVLHYRILQINPDGSSQTIGNAEAGSTFYTYYYLKPYTMTTYYIIAYFKDGRRSKI